MLRPNVFFYGMSGSGKDTGSDFLKNIYSYRKVRIADTIKRIICEKENLTFEELEVQKRTDKRLRQLHHDVGDYLDSQNGTMNRIGQIIKHTALDFQFFSEEEKESMNIVVCDVREMKEAVEFLKDGWIGICLSRKTSETSNHRTDISMFDNGQLDVLKEKYPDQLYIVDNQEFSNYRLKQEILQIINNTEF